MEITEIRESAGGLHVEGTARTPDLGDGMCRRPAVPSAFYLMTTETMHLPPSTGDTRAARQKSHPPVWQDGE